MMIPPKLPSDIYCVQYKADSIDAVIHAIEESERSLIERAEKAEANLSNYESMKMTNESMSKKLLELEAQIPSWIPVYERLPENWKQVLIYPYRHTGVAKCFE